MKKIELNGVKILSIIIIFFSGSTLLGTVYSTFIKGVAVATWKGWAVISLVFILGCGLWGLKNWARIGIIVFSIFGIANHLLSFSLPVSLISICLLALLIYYVTRPNIKEQFK